MKRLDRRFHVVAMASAVILSFSAVGCRTTAPAAEQTDPEIARAANMARLAFDRGSIAQAERLYERALRLARAQDDARECGTLAYNLAVCRAEQGRWDAALSALESARADYERVNRRVDEIALLTADIARQQKRYDEAAALLDGLLSGKDGKLAPMPVECRALAWLIRAQIAVDQGDPAKARDYVKQTRKVAGGERNMSSELQARFAQAEAQIAQAEGCWGESAVAYEREVEVWRKARQFRRMALAMGRAGDAYKAAGAAGPALERYYLAARSLAAQGDDLAALKRIESAMDLAEQRPDSQEAKLLALLFEEIKARTGNEP